MVVLVALLLLLLVVAVCAGLAAAVVALVVVVREAPAVSDAFALLSSSVDSNTSRNNSSFKSRSSTMISV